MRRIPVAAALLAALMACDDGAGPGGGARLDVEAGGGQSDTIGSGGFELAVVATADGEPLAGEPIRFESVGAARVDLGQNAVKSERPVETTTDAGGAARVFVWFADQAGAAVVRVSLPERDEAIEVDYVVLPGSPVGAAVLPADTALQPGNSFRLRASAIDRGGNPTDGGVSLESLAPGVVTVTAGGIATGIDIGRGRVVARFGETAADTAFISVVPDHKLVAVAASGSGNHSLLVFDLDGGNRVILDLLPTDSAVHPDWNPVSARVAYELPHGFGRALQAVDFSAGRGPLIDPATFAVATWPQYSADGQLVYFAGRDAGDEPRRVWRAQADGDVPVPVSAPGLPDVSAPSPSPNGQRVAFAAGDSIRILELASGNAAALTRGAMPRWSPEGARIAFHDGGAIWLIGTTGQGRNRLTSSGTAWHAESLDWSPDGQWIAARSVDDDVLYVIEVATGLALPLGYTAGWSQPAFAPPHVGP